MIEGREIYVPATGDSADSYGNGAGMSKIFEVDKYSRVVYIAPDSGESLTEDDSFQLRRVIEVDSNGNVSRSLPVVDDGGTTPMLGANRTQFEVLIRGSYVIEKLTSTTENVGVYQHYGIDEGA